MLRLRSMTAADVPLGLELCRLAGWNQVEADWQRLLALAPDGVFVAEVDGRPCGTASALCYGTQVAWIGMVLVHPEFRRQGVGSALMEQCIRYLQQRGVESIRLDATDQGRPVYQRLGFRDEQPIWRCAGRAPADPLPSHDVREAAAEDWSGLAALDRRAFRADRMPLLRLLAGECTPVVAPCQGSVRAFGLVRCGFHADFLGPVAGEEATATGAVVRHLLARLADKEVYWDLLPANGAARQMAESLGFRVVRRLTRMCLGSTAHAGNTALVWATAGFELG